MVRSAASRPTVGHEGILAHLTAWWSRSSAAGLTGGPEIHPRRMTTGRGRPLTIGGMSIRAELREILTENSLDIGWVRWAALGAGALLVVGVVRVVSAVATKLSDEAYSRAVDVGEWPGRGR
jgi:hypothetical protein